MALFRPGLVTRGQPGLNGTEVSPGIPPVAGRQVRRAMAKGSWRKRLEAALGFKAPRQGIVTSYGIYEFLEQKTKAVLPVRRKDSAATGAGLLPPPTLRLPSRSRFVHELDDPPDLLLRTETGRV